VQVFGPIAEECQENGDQCQDEGLPGASAADQPRLDKSAGPRSVTWTNKGWFTKPSARSRAGVGWFIARNFKLIGNLVKIQ